ncbi:hypothetical protein Tco_0701901 [Tanacetum coccineum]|uniref:Uncharacterized protein n=1 Tax=Tanacetum coccineum TaxID=301880 RepID=A0ABQ4XUG5_9ASTR
MAFDLRPTEDVLPWPGNANMALDLRPTEDILPWPGPIERRRYEDKQEPAAKKAASPAVGKKADVPSQNKNVREDVDRAEMILESRLGSLIPQTDLLVTWHLAQSESHNATTLKPLFLFEN